MLLKGLAAALAALALSLPVALAADPARVGPGQRVDLKVLLLSADGSEPGYGAWQAQLDREGVPYDTLVAATAPPLTAAQLYAGDHARYQAVILATGDLGHNVANPDGSTSYLSALSDAEWATLAQFERTFGIRRLSDYTAPGPAHGLDGLRRSHAGRRARDADRRRPRSVPVSEGPGDDRRRRHHGGRDLRLSGHAGRRRGLADAAGGTERERVPGHLHAPGRRARGDGHDRREQPVPEPQPTPASRHAQLGHARRLPRLRAQLPRAAGRRPLPGRRRLGPGDQHHQLRPGTGEPHDAARRRPRDRLVARPRAAARHGLQRRRQRAARGADRRRRRARGPLLQSRGPRRVRLHQPHLRAPEPGLLDGVVHHPPDHPQRGLGACPRTDARRSGRARDRRALGPGEHPARQPGHDRPAVDRRRRSRDRRRDPGRHVRIRGHRAYARRRDGGVISLRQRRARRRRFGARELQSRLPRRRL